MAPKKMFLIDGSNHAFRVQFALPPMTAADGFPTRTLYGMTTLLAKLMRVHRPDYVVVAFDKGKTFRHEMYSEYKGNRPPMPEDLAQQWPLLPELVEAFGLSCLHVPGFEADDLLGTLAHQHASKDVQVYLLTSDKDFTQLVNENVVILDLMKGVTVDSAAVIERWGVAPDGIIDLLALAGDKSDNVPGVPGIGPKKAAAYLKRFKTLEGVLANADAVGGKTGQRLVEHAEDARLSKRLVTICTEVPVTETLEDLAPRGLQVERLRILFKRYEFGSIAKRLLPSEPVVHPESVHILRTLPELQRWQGLLEDAGELDYALEMNGGRVVGAAFSLGVKQTAYVAVGRADQVEFTDDDAWRMIRSLLEDPTIVKRGDEVKSDLHALKPHGVHLRGIGGDVGLAHYLIASHEKHELAILSERHLAHTLTALSDVQTLFADHIRLDESGRGVGERVEVIGLLHSLLVSQMSEKMRCLYDDVELPLIPILAGMERRGIALDRERLAVTERRVEEGLHEAEAACHEALGRSFSVNSRNELQAILFEELGLPVQKKTKSGYSTDASVLEKLAHLHPLPAKLLAYRKLSKLLSTYLKALPGTIESDGRVHCRFNQRVASTGRLSCAEPNLQNIPIRTVQGRQIREAFVPKAGHVFLSADYSQIELRVLAHYCEDGPLVHSFLNDEDIHARTASEIFSVAIEEVSSEQRSAAKAINFGIIYGMSAFRLGGELSISRADAEQYMAAYFERLPQVKAWIEHTKALAASQGWIETLYGRKRTFGQISSSRFNERSAAEREAVNMPVQGSSADLVKIAMIRVEERLRSEGSEAQIVLQVHDELLLEVPEGELQRVRQWLVEEMMAAGQLAVPLKVNTASGANWDEAHA